MGFCEVWRGGLGVVGMLGFGGGRVGGECVRGVGGEDDG